MSFGEEMEWDIQTLLYNIILEVVTRESGLPRHGMTYEQ